MTPKTRRSFFASLAALVVAPKVLKRTPRLALWVVPKQDKLFCGLRELVDGGTYMTTFHQEREDFAATLDTLIDRLRAEGRASKRLAKKRSNVEEARSNAHRFAGCKCSA